jgi:hypothetical protein
VRFEPAASAAVLPDLERLPPTAAGPRPDPARTLGPAGTQAAAAETTTETPVEAPPAEALAEPAYLPRSELSRGPAPQHAIDLFYPELAPVGRFRAVLTLFIDEHGVVQRVRIDQADETGLPALLEDTARQTFLQSRFTPGEVEGRPVRAQLRIEVEFAAESRGPAPLARAP